MQRYNGQLLNQFPNTVTGISAAGAKITVRVKSTGALATLYANNSTSGATLENPLTADGKGYYGFYAPDGVYTLDVSLSGTPQLEIQLQDVASLQSQFNDAVSNAGYIPVGTFSAGCTVSQANGVVSDGVSYWRWDGALPKAVTAGSSPTPTGVGGWLLISDSGLRGELSATSSTVSIAGVEASELAVSFAQSVNVKNFGALGNGVNDDTSAIQTAIDSLGAAGGVVIVPAGDYRIDVDVNPTADDFGGIKLKSNVHLVIQKGAKLRALASDKTFTCVVQAYMVSNVSISGGGSIIGERYIHIGTTGEHGMGVAVFGSTGVTIENLTIQDCWGDGVYVGYSNVAGVYTPCSQVYVRNNTIRDCRRQGISIVYTDVFELSHNTIINIQGAAPEAAIDLEPDTASRPNSNGVVVGNRGFNTGQGITLYLKNVNMTITDNIFLARGPALRCANTITNTNIHSNLFVSTTYNDEACGWFDSSSFEEHGTLSVRNNTFVNGGLNGCANIQPNSNRLQFKNNVLTVTVAQIVPLVVLGNANVFDNDVVLSDAALSGANKNAVYATTGAFRGNTFKNLTAQTPQYQYIGTSRITPADTREGVWTPTLVTTGTGFTSVSYGTQTAAKFVKVGTTVFVQGHIRTTSVTLGGASGNVRIGNLPFPAASSGDGLSDWASLSVGFADAWTTLNPTSILIGAGESTARLINSTAAGVSSEMTVSNVNTAAGNIIYFSGHYITSDQT